MKVLAPAVTCLLTSHMKPTLAEAIDSVLAQDRKDFELLVADSGQWISRGDDTSRALAACHDIYAGHPLIEWVTTGERPGLAQRTCPVAWVTNQVIRAGLIRGRYMCTFYDDDLYHPQFTAKMAGYLDAHPEAGAVWCSEARSTVRGDGSTDGGWLTLRQDGTVTEAGAIMASGPRRGATFDCLVDGAQVMWRTRLLAVIGDPWLPESPGDTCRHSDGLFLNKLGLACGEVPAIPDVLVMHRFTPWSTYN